MWRIPRRTTASRRRGTALLLGQSMAETASYVIVRSANRALLVGAGTSRWLTSADEHLFPRAGRTRGSAGPARSRGAHLLRGLDDGAPGRAPGHAGPPARLAARLRPRGDRRAGTGCGLVAPPRG